MPRKDELRLIDIQRIALKLERIITDKESFLTDEITQDAVAYNLLAIGEACSNLSETLKTKHPEVP